MSRVFLAWNLRVTFCTLKKLRFDFFNEFINRKHFKYERKTTSLTAYIYTIASAVNRV